MLIGMVSLVIAVGTMLFVHPATQAARNAANGIQGLMAAISIITNLNAARLKKRQRICSGNEVVADPD